MPPLDSPLSPHRTTGHTFRTAYHNQFLISIVVVVFLGGLTSLLVLDAFRIGHLIVIAAAVLASIWFLFRSDAMLLVLLFSFVAVACPYLAFEGYMEIARWVLLAGATCYLGIRLLASRQHFTFSRELAPIFLFCLWAFGTTAYSPIPQLTFLKAGVFSVLMVFCLLYSEGLPTDLKNSTESFFRSIIIIDAGLIPFSLVLYWTGREFHPPLRPTAVPAAMWGIFGNPNFIGLFTAFLLPILLWYIGSKPRLRYPLALLTAANLYCLIASHSRAGYAATFIALSLYLLLQKPSFVFAYVLAGSMVGILLIAYVPGVLSDLADQYLFKSRESLLESRLGYWKTSVDYIKQNWFWGNGYGVGADTLGTWSVSFSTREIQTIRGSSFLATWEETGLPGLLLIGLYPFWIALRGLHYLISFQQSKGPTFTRILALTSAILAGIVNMLFEEWLLAPGFFATVFFWILIFLLVRELRSMRRGTIQPAPSFSYSTSSR